MEIDEKTGRVALAIEAQYEDEVKVVDALRHLVLNPESRIGEGYKTSTRWIVHFRAK